MATTTAPPAAARQRSWSAEGILTQAWDGLTRPGEGSLRRMYSHVFTPWYWGGAVFASSALYTGMAAQAGLAPAAASLIAAAGAGLAAAVTPQVLRSRWARRRYPLASAWAATETGHTRVVAGAAVAYTAVVAAAAPATAQGWSTTAAAGILTLLGVSARWWQHHRHALVVRRPGLEKIFTGPLPDPEASGAAVPADLHGRITTRWDSHVAAQGKILSGARLIKAEPTTFGVLAKVETVADGQGAEMVRANIGRLGTALKISPSQLEIEDDSPADGAEPDPTVFWIRAISRQIMDVPVPLEDGRSRVVERQGKTLIRLGRYVDGDGEPEWLLYDGTSMWSGYIGGVTGSGKSSLSEGLMLGMMQTGCTYTIYVDPKGGQSSPLIAEHANWFIGDSEPQTWHTLIDGLITLVKERGRYLAAQGTSGFAPSRDFPGIALLFDEFYEVAADPDLAKKVGWLCRKGRSSGVTVVVITQGFGLEDFGHDSVRANATAANAVSLKMKANQASIFMRDFPKSNPARLPDPENEPRNKGLAVSLKGRDCVMRTAYSGDEVTARLMAQAAQVQVKDLDPFSADALDEGTSGMFASRLHDADAAEAAAAEEIAARIARGRRLLTGQAVERAPRTPAPAGDAPGGPAVGVTLPPQVPHRVLVDLGLARQEKAAAAQTARDQVAAPAGVSGAAAEVLAVLRERKVATTSEVVEQLQGRPGCGATAVKAALAELREAGHIIKPGSRKAPWRLA
ncbi:type IV secretory system conjugative DNA transfer family protein [Nocardiopsis algeriensis]|uniref:Uncharacterized protein n=1 Tax=Nocardiopsis algeriensis TaxID=1478215 RepID=A0A841IU45_9ACTN|nr:type IV secretory system conjugative DNA transfer family protein [Nocardiopsis algeriensis]MBB6122193.1 hypothetical protein [Nocardiopsis algeriensis]